MGWFGGLSRKRKNWGSLTVIKNEAALVIEQLVFPIDIEGSFSWQRL